MRTEFLAYHNNKACDLVKEMLEMCKAAMKELGLRSLRIEDDPCVVTYDYDNINYVGLSEHTVQAIYIDDDDDLILRMQPYSPSVKFTNEETTGPDCPELDFETDETIIWVDSEDVMYLSLLSLDDHIAAALDSYIRENRPFVEKEYFCGNVGDYRDSMELDSCQELASLEGYIGKHTVEANVIVSGSVRVIFRDQVYKAASRMPKELLQCYHEGGDPAALATSTAKTAATPSSSRAGR